MMLVALSLMPRLNCRTLCFFCGWGCRVQGYDAVLEWDSSAPWLPPNQFLHLNFTERCGPPNAGRRQWPACVRNRVRNGAVASPTPNLHFGDDLRRLKLIKVAIPSA